DQESIFKPVAKKVWTIPSIDRIPELFQEAFRVSQSGRKGPVVLNLPRNLMSETYKYNEFFTPDMYSIINHSSGDPDKIQQAGEMLLNAKKPLIIAGAGIKWSNAQKELLDLSKILDSPLVASAGHGDCISNDFSLYGGQVGPRGNEVATNLARQADVILALGTRLGFNSTFYSYDNLNKDAKITQVDIEQTAISRYFPINTGI